MVIAYFVLVEHVNGPGAIRVDGPFMERRWH